MITDIFKNYEESVLNRLGLSYTGLNICELGNQSYMSKPAKIMYEKKGSKHTSIDINGRGGALPFDLDKPLPGTLSNKFDLITNYGTTEHVNKQYSVFKNIHFLGKTGCIVIHGVPLAGNWKKHCRYYYSTKFFSNLAIACSYSVVDLYLMDKDFFKHPKNLVVCVLKKEKDNFFIKEKSFNSLTGLHDSKDVTRTGDYS